MSSCFIRKWVSFRSRTRNAILVHLACQLVKVPFLFVSQQKATVVFDVALAVLPIWNNTFGINWYIALLPNPVGSTTKIYLPWHTFLWRRSICLSLRVLWTKLSREAFKANKNSLSWLASSDAISSRDFFDWKSHCHTGNQSWLSSKYLLFLTNQRKVQILKKKGRLIAGWFTCDVPSDVQYYRDPKLPILIIYGPNRVRLGCLKCAVLYYTL